MSIDQYEEQGMKIYDAVAELPPAQIWDGVVARIVNGERLTIGFVDLDPKVAVPEHRHENEQVGFVLRGSITMVIGGESKTLSVGNAYRIASQLPHSATAGAGGATVVDVFAPVRADWDKAPRLKPFPGGWPEKSR
jgi:quercetin dioxygenase-like cupin family protein